MKMKLNPLCAVFTATLAGSVLVLAQADTNPDRPARPGDGKGRPPGGFLMQLDKDGDKAISQEEAGDKWERMSQLDKNGDGKVDGNEIPQFGPGKGPGGPGKGPGGGEFFNRADKNQDGKLAQDEVPPEAWEKMSKADKDGDGAVTKEELMAAWQGREGGPGKGGPGGDFFAQADKNQDGKLTQDEVPAQFWERLSKADKDGDGAVSKEELPPRPGGPGGPGKGPGGPGKGPGEPGAFFEKSDKDGDGKLSNEEVPAEMWEKISKADKDADGLVSKEELQKAFSEQPGKGGPKGERWRRAIRKVNVRKWRNPIRIKSDSAFRS